MEKDGRSNPIETRSNHRRAGVKRTANMFNPLRTGIEEYITKHLPPTTLSAYGLSLETLASSLPKRFTVYEPMLLLPLNAFTHPPAWGSLYESLDGQQRQSLYASIVDAFSQMGVSHIAINAPIVLTDSQGHENRMRSPAGLVPLYGDFGPSPAGDGEEGQPSENDFQQAFWVRTTQNQGIVQTWAPLYTMFSRGNITEKARILGQGTTFEGLDARSLGEDRVQDISVVDMYAGIGYFVFSYLKRGVKRVWGWEINGWSVEGLRKGCFANGWGCRVVRVAQDGQLSQPVTELIDGLQDTDRVVVFQGDNRFAADIMTAIRGIMEPRKTWNSIRHVNLGLLPTSSASWENACQLIDSSKGGWIHAHENVDVREIDKKKAEITIQINQLWTGTACHSGDRETEVECRHVEQVKTYAPGVMHCVFDLQLLPNHQTINGIEL